MLPKISKATSSCLPSSHVEVVHALHGGYCMYSRWDPFLQSRPSHPTGEWSPFATWSIGSSHAQNVGPISWSIMTCAITIAAESLLRSCPGEMSHYGYGGFTMAFPLASIRLVRHGRSSRNARLVSTTHSCSTKIRFTFIYKERTLLVSLRKMLRLNHAHHQLYSVLRYNL